MYLRKYVIEQLCRGMLQNVLRSFGGLLDRMVVSKRESTGNTMYLYMIIHVEISTLSSTAFL